MFIAAQLAIEPPEAVIYRANFSSDLNGTAVENLVGIALDRTAGKMYWCNLFEDKSRSLTKPKRVADRWTFLARLETLR